MGRAKEDHILESLRGHILLAGYAMLNVRSMPRVISRLSDVSTSISGGRLGDLDWWFIVRLLLAGCFV